MKRWLRYQKWNLLAAAGAVLIFYVGPYWWMREFHTFELKSDLGNVRIVRFPGGTPNPAIHLFEPLRILDAWVTQDEVIVQAGREYPIID